MCQSNEYAGHGEAMPFATVFGGILHRENFVKIGEFGEFALYLNQILS